MSRVCCPGCRLRFPRSAEAGMSLCPHCGLPLAPVSGPGSLLGYRLFGPLDDPHALPEALEAALPLPIFETHGPWMDLG